MSDTTIRNRYMLAEGEDVDFDVEDDHPEKGVISALCAAIDDRIATHKLTMIDLYWEER